MPLSHVREYLISRDITDDVNFDHLVKVILPDVSSIKLLFYLFLYCILWKPVAKSSPHSKVGGATHHFRGRGRSYIYEASVNVLSSV